MDTKKSTAALHTLQGDINPLAMPLKEKSLFGLTKSAREAIEFLEGLMDKIARGVKLTEQDRQDYKNAVAFFPDYLGNLLGREYPAYNGYATDCTRAQNCVDDYIKELVEDGDDITGAVFKALTAKDVECTEKTMRWRDHVSSTEEHSVEVLVPDVIFEDGELRQALEEKLDDEVRYELEQEVEPEYHEVHETEYDLE